MATRARARAKVLAITEDEEVEMRRADQLARAEASLRAATVAMEVDEEEDDTVSEVLVLEDLASEVDTIVAPHHLSHSEAQAAHLI